MSWREILNPNPSDFSDKSQNDPFSHYCHQNQDIKNKDLEDKNYVDTPKSHTDTIAVPAYFDELEREYFFNLVEFMESPEHRMDRQTAEQEAFKIVDEYRSRKKKRKLMRYSIS